MRSGASCCRLADSLLVATLAHLAPGLVRQEARFREVVGVRELRRDPFTFTSRRGGAELDLDQALTALRRRDTNECERAGEYRQSQPIQRFEHPL